MERWKSIKALPNYVISDNGRVKAKARYDSRGHFLKERLLCITNLNGYPAVSLRIDGRNKIYYIHQLMIWAFKGKAPGTYGQVRHLDDDKLNCRLSNLKPDKTIENYADRNRHGKHNIGSRNGQVKLTSKDVGDIRRSSKTANELAIKYSVSDMHIRAIRSGRFWNIEKQYDLLKSQIDYGASRKTVSSTFKDLKAISTRSDPFYLKGKKLYDIFRQNATV